MCGPCLRELSETVSPGSCAPRSQSGEARDVAEGFAIVFAGRGGDETVFR